MIIIDVNFKLISVHYFYLQFYVNSQIYIMHKDYQNYQYIYYLIFTVTLIQFIVISINHEKLYKKISLSISLT